MLMVRDALMFFVGVLCVHGVEIVVRESSG